jgi:hypothetical protein
MVFENRCGPAVEGLLAGTTEGVKFVFPIHGRELYHGCWIYVFVVDKMATILVLLRDSPLEL